MGNLDAIDHDLALDLTLEIQKVQSWSDFRDQNRLIAHNGELGDRLALGQTGHSDPIEQDRH